MATLPHYHNQLQFNLEVPVVPTNMAVKFHRPEPIIVEKFGASMPPSLVRMSPVTPPNFSFTSLSEQNLSAAVQLAQRDMKKKREQEQLELSLSKATKANKRGKSPYKVRMTGVTPGTNRKDTKDRMKNSRSTRQPVGKLSSVKEKRPVARPPWRSVTSRSITPPNAVLHIRQDSHLLPASSSSPPQRDTDPVKFKSQEERIMNEIQRLRKEITKCLDHIKRVDDVAKQGEVKLAHLLPGEEDLPSQELSKRRIMRMEEYSIRASRTVYGIQQQVKDIHTDLEKLRPDQITGDRKTHFLNRLASAHRATVRVLQAFTSQMPEWDISNGLPKVYLEIGLLVRQLSLSCAQLEVAGETGVPESVMHLIKDMEEVNKDLEQQLHIAPAPAPPQLAEPESTQHSAPPSRKLLDGKAPKMAIHKELIQVKGGANKENKLPAKKKKVPTATLR